MKAVNEPPALTSEQLLDEVRNIMKRHFPDASEDEQIQVWESVTREARKLQMDLHRRRLL